MRVVLEVPKKVNVFVVVKTVVEQLLRVRWGRRVSVEGSEELSGVVK